MRLRAQSRQGTLLNETTAPPPTGVSIGIATARPVYTLKTISTYLISRALPSRNHGSPLTAGTTAPIPPGPPNRQVNITP